MMMKNRLAILIPLLILFALALAGCGLGEAPAGRVPGPDFSRGVPVSSNVGGTASMMVDETAQAIHFAWPTAADDLAHIHYQQLNGAAEVVADLDLNLPEGRQRTPRLLAAGENKVHLFWANRLPGSPGWSLWHALLDGAGAVTGQPEQVSPDEMRVGDYTVAQNNRGQAYVIWEDDSGRGLWAARVTADDFEAEPTQLTESGESPGAYLEEDGTLHLAWLSELGVNYAAFQGGELSLVEGQQIAELQEIIANLDGPAVGVAGDWVYVLWSVFARTGLESGNGWTEYVAFPRDDYSPGKLSTQPAKRVWMLSDEEQPYDTFDGAYALTQLAPAVTSPALSTNYVLEPDAASGRENELAVAVASNQDYRLEEYIQMAVLIFREGEFDGYQMASKTQGFSMEGILQSDSAGNLYVAWREGTGRELYFAATEQSLRGKLNQFGQADLLQALVGGGLEAITGVLFFPLSLIWFVPGALLLGIRKLRRDDETINDPSSPIFVAVAILLYQGTKILFLPSIANYVPFSAWIDIPAGLETMLKIAVPLFSFGLGILIAEIIRRRRDAMSSLLYFFIACGVDAIITLMIYGVNYLGVM